MFDLIQISKVSRTALVGFCWDISMAPVFSSTCSLWRVKPCNMIELLFPQTEDWCFVWQSEFVARVGLCFILLTLNVFSVEV